jgi:hypothetical protein
MVRASASLFCLALLAVSPAAADAQCRLCDARTTVRDEQRAQGDVRLEVQTSLSFDRLVLLGAGSGSAMIKPDGSSSAEGAVLNVGPRAIVGTVAVHGEPGRALMVEIPRRIELYSISGGRITVEDLASDLKSLPRLDAAGNLTFRIGGRVRVDGNADGDYRGDLPISVDYQ